MIKILFFIDTLEGGGAEKVLRNLVNNMEQSKFEITVQTVDECDASKYLSEGIRYKAINRCKSKWGKKIFSYLYRLLAELKLAYSVWVKEDYDIEVAYLETGATKLIAQSTNKKAVKLAWVHCDFSKNERMKDSHKKLQKQYKQFDKIICVSQGVEEGFKQVINTNLNTTVLYNVIDEDEILSKAQQDMKFSKEDNTIQLLAVGRLSPEKNFEYLIDSCYKLKQENIMFKLTILGEGPERTNLENQIQRLGMEDVVELKGFVNNPYPYMKQADIIVCSSLYEGISTVVQEALILGKPVVTTPCTGMKELLGESEYGVIVENTKDGLYKSLLKVIKEKNIILKYKQKSKMRGAFFSKEKILKDTEQILKLELEAKIINGGKNERKCH